MATDRILILLPEWRESTKLYQSIREGKTIYTVCCLLADLEKQQMEC